MPQTVRRGGFGHINPKPAEANKYAAGAWKRNHAQQRLLRWAERYHRWERGEPPGCG